MTQGRLSTWPCELGIHRSELDAAPPAPKSLPTTLEHPLLITSTIGMIEYRVGSCEITFELGLYT